MVERRYLYSKQQKKDEAEVQKCGSSDYREVITLEDKLKYNGSGYRDMVAERAIRKADHIPHEVSELVDVIKKIAGAYGYDIESRISFRDRKTKIVYR